MRSTDTTRIAQSRNRASYENWLAGLLHDCMVLDVQEPTTHHYAEICLELKRKGKPMPTNDIWIAPAAFSSPVEPRPPFRFGGRNQAAKLTNTKTGIILDQFLYGTEHSKL